MTIIPDREFCEELAGLQWAELIEGMDEKEVKCMKTITNYSLLKGMFFAGHLAGISDGIDLAQQIRREGKAG